MKLLMCVVTDGVVCLSITRGVVGFDKVHCKTCNLNHWQIGLVLDSIFFYIHFIIKYYILSYFFRVF